MRLKLLCLLCFLCFFCLLLWADATGNLFPIADGSTEGWANTGAAACSTTDCWDEVDDTSGASCTTTPSNGDTDFNSSGTTNGTIQQYDIDESSTPDGATVQSAIIYICGRKDAGSGATTNTVMSFCVNGSCTDGATVAPGSSYADFNSGTIDFADDTKDGSDDYELKIRNTQARSVRISAIKTVITYTPPATNKRRAQTLVVRLRPRGAEPARAD